MSACPYCGMWPAHSPEKCYRVRAIEYHKDGRIKRIEFHAPANNPPQWPAFIGPLPPWISTCGGRQQ